MASRGDSLALITQVHPPQAPVELTLVVDQQAYPVADGRLDAAIRDEAARAGLELVGVLSCEGIAARADGWMLACGTPPEAPQGAFGFFVEIDPEGRLQRISPPLRDEQGAFFQDFVGSLDLSADGLAIVGGFLRPEVYLFTTDGTLLARMPSPTDRIEGIALDEAHGRLLMVRECSGSDAQCDQEQGDVTLAALPALGLLEAPGSL